MLLEHDNAYLCDLLEAKMEKFRAKADAALAILQQGDITFGHREFAVAGASGVRQISFTPQ